MSIIGTRRTICGNDTKRAILEYNRWTEKQLDKHDCVGEKRRNRFQYRSQNPIHKIIKNYAVLISAIAIPYDC